MTRKWLVLLPLLLVPCVVMVAGASGPRDRDRDGLPDRWEKRHHLSTKKKSGKRDPDRDGLRNRREYRLRTNPRHKDTDRDGLRDGAEVRKYKTNPRRKDTDRDGFSDKAEIRAGTNPRDRHSHPTRAAHPAPPPPPAPPAPTGFPGAADTGVPPGTALTPSGSLTIGTPGTVVDGRHITGCVTVNADNVTIRNSKIDCGGSTGIKSNAGGLVVEHVEIDLGNRKGAMGIGDSGYTARHVNVHGGENGLWAEHNVVIEDSYVHDLVDYDPATDPHTDGVQIPSGASNVTIRHNTIYGNYVNQSSFGNSAITTGGNTTNIAITGNLLAGGGWTIYCNQPGRGSNFVLANNHFSRIFSNRVGGYGPWEECRDEQVSGNVYHESGQPL